MKSKKTVLIITDGASETVKMADGIVTVLKGNKVSVKPGAEFKGNDILPAQAFFLGCEKPSPGSFAYLEDLLKHINLAGRPCGIFSPGSEKAVRYLKGLLKDCEAAMNPRALTADSVKGIKKWALDVISGSF